MKIMRAFALLLSVLSLSTPCSCEVKTLQIKTLKADYSDLPKGWPTKHKLGKGLQDMEDIATWRGTVKYNDKGFWTENTGGKWKEGILLVIGGAYPGRGRDMNAVDPLLKAGYNVWVNRISSVSFAVTHGREQWGYLNYLADPERPRADIVVFLHGHAKAWHHDNIPLQRLVETAVSCSQDTRNVADLNAHWMEDPEASEAVVELWNRLLGPFGRPMQKGVAVSSPSAAQFAVPFGRIDENPIEFYQAALHAVLTDEAYDGWFFEYTWHFMFGEAQDMTKIRNRYPCPPPLPVVKKMPIHSKAAVAMFVFVASVLGLKIAMRALR